MVTDDKIDELLDLIKKNKIFAPNSNDFNMSESGMKFILGYLTINKEATAGEIATKLNVSTARVAVLINKLLKKELIIKKKDIKDSRVTIICLSDKGMELSKNISNIQRKIMRSFIDEIGYERLEMFFNTALLLKEKMKEFKKEIDESDKNI